MLRINNAYTSLILSQPGFSLDFQKTVLSGIEQGILSLLIKSLLAYSPDTDGIYLRSLDYCDLEQGE